MRKFLSSITIIVTLVMIGGCESSDKELIGGDFYRNDKNVFLKVVGEWGMSVKYIELLGANLDTFEVLGDYVGKDDKNVYLFWEKQNIPSLDVKTFEAFPNSVYAKDKNNIYYTEGFQVPVSLEVLQNADYDSFDIFEPSYVLEENEKIEYAKDKDKVFSGKDVFVGNVDVETFDRVGVIYFKDKNYVYNSYSKKIAEADPNTFGMLFFDSEYSDKKSISSYAKDRKYIYCDRGQILKEADIATFTALGYDLGEDKNQKYRGCNVFH